MCSVIDNPGSKTWKECFEPFLQFYQLDFKDTLKTVRAELNDWETFWRTYKGQLPDNVSSTLKIIHYPCFKNLKIALRILGTLPVTSCECERSFSTLKRLKTYTRSSMGEERLNGLALMHVHHDIIPNVDDVINKFADSGKRRLEFSL